MFGVPDEDSGEKVKAVLAAPAGASKMTVRTHCVRNLAEFKHPKVIEIRTELPKSPLGKVLRKYLLDEASGGGPTFVFDPRTGFLVAPEVRRMLIEGKKGIGELLRQNKKETYRELSTVRRAEAGEWAIHLGVERDAGILIRDYSIRLDGRAAMQIEEIFPIARFPASA